MADPFSEYVDPRQNDRRSTNELISVALSDPDTFDGGGWDAVVALHWRGSQEVLNRSVPLCQSHCCAVERRVGADILGQLGFSERTLIRERLNILVKMLRVEPDTRDEDAHVRDWAIFGLGTMVETVDSLPLRDALLERLSDSNEVVRSEALIGLARRKDGRGVPALLKELTADSVDVGVIEAAALIADPQLHSALVAIRTRREGEDWLLEQAILACSPRRELA